MRIRRGIFFFPTDGLWSCRALAKSAVLLAILVPAIASSSEREIRVWLIPAENAGPNDIAHGEDVPSKIKDWTENIDLEGRNLHAFAADVCAESPPSAPDL